MDTKLLIIIICAIAVIYSINVIISRYKQYKASTDPAERNRKIMAIIMAIVLLILVAVTLILSFVMN